MDGYYKIKEISKYYEEHGIAYHYIWYYIDDKSKRKIPIGEYNKAIKKTVEQKLYKQNMEGMKMTLNQENKLKLLNENEKKNMVISYTSFLKHTDNIYCIDIDDVNIKTPLDLPEEFGKIRLSGYIKGNTKGIHIYIKILNMVIYDNQQDVIKLLKGDLIRENNIWEKVDKKYNYKEGYEEIMIIEWDDIKYLFDNDKMNIIKRDDNNTIINLKDLDNITLENEKTYNIYENKESDEKTIVSELTDIFNIKNNNIIDIKSLKKYLEGLNIEKRCDGYHDWKKVVWGIANICRDNNWEIKIRDELIHNFSKRS
jgi:hypothetical protein